MKKILFDLLSAQPIGNTKFHGAGEYIKAIFKNITEKFINECEIIVFYNKDAFIDDWIKKILNDKSIKTYDIKKTEDINLIFKQEKIDVFYSGMPYNLKRNYIPKDICIIGTIHGLRQIEKDLDEYSYLYTEKHRFIINKIKMITRYEFKRRKKNYSNVIQILDKIICDSEHTKYSICNYYPEVSMDKVEVFYAPNKEISNTEEISKEISNEKFILIISANRWIKNSYRAIQAIDGLFSDGRLKDYKIKVVGGLSTKIKKRIKHIEKCEILDYVSTEKLEELYKSCDIFIYPSLNEGFGLPPLEAMKYGKTCVVSAVTSLPEICGDAVYYINPYDINEMRTRILNATNRKINPKEAINRYNYILKKQEKDIINICKYIIE